MVGGEGGFSRPPDPDHRTLNRRMLPNFGAGMTTED